MAGKPTKKAAAKKEAAKKATTKKKTSKRPAKAAKKPAAKRGAEAAEPRRTVAEPPGQASASELIDARIEGLGDWRGETLARVRALIRKAVPGVVEEVKWRKPSNAMKGVPVWSRDGILCTGETYKDKVKLTFAKGADLDDPAGLFNASLGGAARRAVDIREGDTLDERAFKALVRAAAALNASDAKPRSKGTAAKGKRSASAKAKGASGSAKPRLLSGGNPQIPKGDGDAPVRAYIEAMPGWKRDVGRRLDALIEGAVPGVRKAVKWNSPLYGVEGRGWFLGVHCFTKYVKVAFFRGASLRPLPPVESKQKDVRYFHVHEGDRIDEARFVAWVKQASRLPGERM